MEEGDATKKSFLNWILVAEILHNMKSLRDKVSNDVFVKSPFFGDSDSWLFVNEY